MFNNELYKILEDQFGVERMRSFAEIMAVRHDVLFNDSEEALNGEDFERDWWRNKFYELLALPKDPGSIEDAMNILREKGYSNFQVKLRNDFEDDEELRIRETNQQGFQNL